MSVADAYLRLRSKAKSNNDHYNLAYTLMLLKYKGVDLTSLTYEQVTSLDVS